MSISEVQLPADEQKADVQAQTTGVDNDPFRIDHFEEGDPDNPLNWSHAKRWFLTMLGGLLVLNASFASSAPSGIFPQLQEEFKMSKTVGVLTISLFLTGYCVGPLLWGPLSEVYGRRPVFLYPFLVYTCFSAGGALAKNTASVLIFRFLSGTFAAAPITNSGALVSDIWDADIRGKAMAIFTIAPFAGPALGPTVAGFVGENTSWRWLFWVLTLFAGLCDVLILFFLPETYIPILLAKKAKAKRLDTKDERHYAPIEREEKLPFSKRIEHILAQPFVILFHEPMLIALVLYMSFVYGCLYLLFDAYPIVFTQGHGFSQGISGLMFLPIPIGGALAVIMNIMYFNPQYQKEQRRCSPRPVAPEYRLVVMFNASPLFAASFFWFAWTSFPRITFWAPMLSGLLMGYTIQLIFMGLLNYTVDAYLSVAASAMAAMTVVRSLFGAGFPLFADQMYEALNPRWASSLLGFVAVLLTPIPFVLYRYGPQLRIKSRYCPYNAEDETPRHKESDEKGPSSKA